MEDDLIGAPGIGMQTETPSRWRRRDVVKGLGALAGSAVLLGYDFRFANAEPPPETTRLRILIDAGAPLVALAA
jgi:hypothetical protein